MGRKSPLGGYGRIPPPERRETAKNSRPEIVRECLLCDQYLISVRRTPAAVCKADVDHDAPGNHQ